jgi:hypothetical protein
MLLSSRRGIEFRQQSEFFRRLMLPIVGDGKT